MKGFAFTVVVDRSVETSVPHVLLSSNTLPSSLDSENSKHYSVMIVIANHFPVF